MIEGMQQTAALQPNLLRLVGLLLYAIVQIINVISNKNLLIVGVSE